ncbi:hypothetical protein K443DRAFT_13202 [Laccaria amethystina LaAM-08-1]|uniref:Uncharacterized protein n=1 Tax=Laccaria amethystina LaAM-08-1 TaxID=1095629 RepID=A0A0C9X9N1_9AGAR|nr:hypothetical protein K443DRAFT_13202 [Laccaria amethystina LaAM-08-1]
MFFSIFSKSKKAKKTYEATRFPSDWPSYLHNKCSVPTCYYPNAPQVAEGLFHCGYKARGFYCEGTYIVTTAMAKSALLSYENDSRFQVDVVRQAERDAQVKRYKETKSQLEKEARERAAARTPERRAKDAKRGCTSPREQYMALERKDAVRLRHKSPVPTCQLQPPSIRRLPVPPCKSQPEQRPRPLPQLPRQHISEPHPIQQQQPHSLYPAQRPQFESYHYPRRAPRPPRAPTVQHRNH